MSISLPYLAAPGSIKTALEKIKIAAMPDRVTVDFVKTKLQIQGGTGAAILPFLKKIGFVASDGSPTELYRRLRNPTTAGFAVAEAIKKGYIELAKANEYFYELNDKELLSLIVQITGVEADSVVAKYTVSTIKALKTIANFDASPSTEDESIKIPLKADPNLENHLSTHDTVKRQSSVNLSYTINLNLPSTSDQAVFNAIFKSLKEHLITEND